MYILGSALGGKLLVVSALRKSAFYVFSHLYDKISYKKENSEMDFWVPRKEGECLG